MKTINFICRGNVFRSRLAEAYFNSLKLPNFKAISTGAQATEYAQENKHIEEYTLDYLKRLGYEKFTKHSLTQLTQDALNSSDINICMTQTVADNIGGLMLPEDTLVWDIQDIGGDETDPLPLEEYEQGYNITFEKIKKRIDEFIKNLPSS